MTQNLAERIRATLEEYRGRIKMGGHPKELPDRILALVRKSPANEPIPKDLVQLHTAGLHYWKIYDDLSNGNLEPDPIDRQMVYDALIDALYDFYDVR